MSVLDTIIEKTKSISGLLGKTANNPIRQELTPSEEKIAISSILHGSQNEDRVEHGKNNQADVLHMITSKIHTIQSLSTTYSILENTFNQDISSMTREDVYANAQAMRKVIELLRILDKGQRHAGENPVDLDEQYTDFNFDMMSSDHNLRKTAENLGRKILTLRNASSRLGEYSDFLKQYSNYILGLKNRLVIDYNNLASTINNRDDTNIHIPVFETINISLGTINEVAQTLENTQNIGAINRDTSNWNSFRDELISSIQKTNGLGLDKNRPEGDRMLTSLIEAGQEFNSERSLQEIR